MKIIVGLGNPGEKYKNTRHNLGFMALDELIKKFEPVEKTFWENNKNLKAEIKKIEFKKSKAGETTPILLAKPTTFMNTSGFAVSKTLNYYKIPPSEMIIIHDDSDLPLGKIRVRFGGASSGHRGVQSVIDVLSTDKFLRIRLGIGRPTDERLGREKRYDLDRYVLAPFSGKDRGEIKHMIRETTKAISVILEKGLDIYMSKYNK